MTITTLIGLTQEEIDRAREEHDREYFQLEEITRHYKARMFRRAQKINIMRKLAYSTSYKDWELYSRRWAKLKELNKHDDRDHVRWLAGMERCIALSQRWNAMTDELKAAEKSA